MSWSLTGELVETCSCNTLCPCWFGVQDLMKMDKGWCDSTLLFRLTRGEANGVDLNGCTLVLAQGFPGPTLLDGNGTARLYIDEAATADQRRELESIFQGKVGGPMEILAGLMSTWLPTSFCAIDLKDDGSELSAKVRGGGEIKSSVLKSEAGEAMTVDHSGFAGAFQFEDERFKVAPSATRWTDPGLPREFETHSGVRADLTWKVA